ncbi:hypothetical protein RJT34_00148 [Clitoria ternatea]|uniref:Uncharacterized protein n=1 Tax=Clitoria ternatea TaxID=43366 RepID=A0AAN9PZ51_CLITE
MLHLKDILHMWSHIYCLHRPRKARHSREKASPAITNFIPYASSQGHFTHVVPPLQPSQGAQHAPTLTVIPTTQSLVPTSDPPLRKMPRKTKHSRERASLGITSFMPYASSQGHSTPVEPPLQPSKVAQSSAPFLTHVPPSVPTAQNPVIPSGPPLPGHSTHLEPPLQPSLVAHSSAPTITHIPLSIATTQNLVSPSDPPLHKKSRKAKHSKKKVCHGLSNLMPHSSCQGHSTHVEPLLQPLELAQSRSPTSTHIPSSISAAPDPVSTSQPPSHMSHTNIFSGILKLMHHASYQGHTIPVESSQQPSTQHSAPTVTYIPPSIPTAEDLLSPSDLPSCLKPKSKHSKQRVSKGVSSLMPHATSEVHSKPLVPQLQLPEVAQHCAPIPPSIPIAEDSDSQSDDSEPSSSSMLHSEGHSIPLEPSLYPPEVAQHSAPIVTPIPPSIPIAEDSDSPSDDSDQSSHRTSDSGTFVPLSTHTRKILSNRSYGGRQWPVKAIDEHGRSQKIHVTKAGVFGMPPGQRIVVPFDRQLRAYGEAATLLSAACGHIVTNPKNVPINFNSWRKVPKSHKDHCFSILKTLFHFEASDSVARRYCLLTMSTKYRNGKMYLWTRMFDPSLSREQLIVKVPDGIPKDQWSSFVGYHLSPEYQELCRKNAEVRKKQTIPHTGGSKLLSRKQHEMEQELGRAVGRAELYIATHTRKDGSYINEEARSIGELQLAGNYRKPLSTYEVIWNKKYSSVGMPTVTGIYNYIFNTEESSGEDETTPQSGSSLGSNRH